MTPTQTHAVQRLIEARVAVLRAPTDDRLAKFRAALKAYREAWRLPWMWPTDRVEVHGLRMSAQLGEQRRTATWDDRRAA